MERLQKVIANSGFTSRRKAEDLITAGKVTVNGKIIRELGTKVSNEDVIAVGKEIIKTDQKLVYYLLNKPSGYICSLKDEKNRKIVTDLIPTDYRIYPVGRLDYDTTGLLLLTNDGEFANNLMHPSNNIEKVYRATIDNFLSTDDIYKIKNGRLEIEGKKVTVTRFKIKKRNYNKKTEIIEIGIIEGRNHIVKKIFSSLGLNVIKLKRESFAFLTLDNLKVGDYRPLTINELKKLRSLKK